MSSLLAQNSPELNIIYGLLRRLTPSRNDLWSTYESLRANVCERGNPSFPPTIVILA
ncbi:hypothetical protein RiCNE_04130 [Rickettsia endosymbiont of Culicoides newsteadi]|nr:hypothetical protein RiCNE_04130 [Rickettsia endosymbiont of Culicoides newsteadi]